MNRPTDHYILRDIDNRDDGGAPYETRPTTLADLANYVDGPLLSDLTDPSNADEVRCIAAEMREGRLSDESHARLRGLSVYIRKAVDPSPSFHTGEHETCPACIANAKKGARR